MKFFESFAFFTRYIRNPSSVGAVCPSSRFLAQKMVAPVKSVVEDKSIVVELGSGTGAVTKYILSELNISPKQLYCVEFDTTSAELLLDKFPDTNVVNDSAENLVQILGKDIDNLKCIVSCLPLLSLSDDCAQKILQCVENVLPEGGIFVQFTYNLLKPSADKYIKNLKRVNTMYTALNIPPARIDVYTK
ncbi:MAG: hypothetical protein J6B07_01790 [Opitutales bacterium]|nr:hypothetical protein [Opitutales bacterium]